MTNPSDLRLRADVTLAHLTADHAPNMYRWMCDPTVRENIGLRSAPSLERTMEWIANAAQSLSVHARAILWNGRHVGNVVLDHIDPYLASARLSIYIGETAARGAGIGLTGMYHALAEGFQHGDLHKVWLTVHVRNYPAIAMYTKLGFVLEGVHRDEFLLAGERIAVFYMGLLHNDFARLIANEASGVGTR